VTLVFSEVTHVNQYDDAGPRRMYCARCMFLPRVSTVPRETEGMAVCHWPQHPERSRAVQGLRRFSRPEGTGGVCVKAPTDVEGERLALCDLNNTRVGHYRGYGWID
jgi:hypothetical protein